MPKHLWFRLLPVRSPLLRESLLFSFPPGNEMFQFPGFALPMLTGVSVCWLMGCPIRISADQLLFAHPRSFSQLITSFFASKSQGILRTPLFTFSRLWWQHHWYHRISPLRISSKILFLPACQWTLPFLAGRSRRNRTFILAPNHITILISEPASRPNLM